MNIDKSTISVEEKESEFDILKTKLENSSRANKNNLLLFISFSTYILVSIVSTNDVKFLFPELGIHLPILNIDINLVFYGFIGIFLLTILYISTIINLKEHFYLIKEYKKAIKKEPYKRAKYIVSVPFIFDYAYLYSLSKSNIFKVIIYILLVIYIPSIFIIYIWWFAKFHNLFLTSWQIICFFIALFFQYKLASYLLNNITVKFTVIILPIFTILHLYIIFTLISLFILNSDIREKFKFFPRITIESTEKLPLPNITQYKEYLNLMTNLNYKDSNSSIGSITYFPRINLNNRDLRYANLNDIFLPYASIKNSQLKYANLNNTNLYATDFSYSSLSNSSINSANLNSVNFDNSNLSYSFIENSDLSYSSINDANLSNSYLFDSNFKYSSIINTDLSKSNLTGVNFSFATLNYNNFSYSNISFSKFIFTQCWNSIFEYSNLSYVDLKNSDFSQALLFRVNLANIKNYKSVNWKDSLVIEPITNNKEVKYFFNKPNFKNIKNYPKLSKNNIHFFISIAINAKNPQIKTDAQEFLLKELYKNKNNLNYFAIFSYKLYINKWINNNKILTKEQKNILTQALKNIK